MNSQNDTHHPALDISKRANELAKKLAQLAKIQATSLHSSASYVEHLKSSHSPATAPAQIQDGINAQVLSFCARVPELLSSCGLVKSSESAHANQEPGVVLLKIAEQSSKSLQPAQNFAIVERMFDAAMKHLARSIAEQEESKAVIQKLQAELARNKRDDLLRSWQDETKRNSENQQGKIESMEQEISHLKHASKEFGAKVSLRRLGASSCAAYHLTTVGWHNP